MFTFLNYSYNQLIYDIKQKCKQTWNLYKLLCNSRYITKINVTFNFFLKKSKQTAEISWLFFPNLVQWKSEVNKIVLKFFKKFRNQFFIAIAWNWEKKFFENFSNFFYFFAFSKLFSRTSFLRHIHWPKQYWVLGITQKPKLRK